MNSPELGVLRLSSRTLHESFWSADTTCRTRPFELYKWEWMKLADSVAASRYVGLDVASANKADNLEERLNGRR